MRIGIIGAGQLGLMLAMAAARRGHQCRFLDPADTPPAAAVGPVIQAAYDDPAGLAELAAQSDVITYEFENVPVAALEAIAGSTPVYPPLPALRCAQDRLTEKTLFEDLDIPLPGYRRVDTAEDLVAAGEALDWPLIVKTRRLGYDGKGQARLGSASEAAAVFAALGGQDLIAEQCVDFDYEVSAIGTRGQDGATAHYCLTRNTHRDGILRESVAPLDNVALTSAAQALMQRLLDHFDYVGTLALELFVVGNELLANEYAPRVHNSGHWTIEGTASSQFDNHIRAVCGESLGEPAATAHAAMVNLIGTISGEARTPAFGILHDYGKAERPGRKLGHITLTADNPDERDANLAALSQSVN